jgi:hypothetical protein
MSNGKCMICNKEIPQNEDGQGSYMTASLSLHHPIYPALKTTYEGHWICHKCARDIANNICENDSLI